MRKAAIILVVILALSLAITNGTARAAATDNITLTVTIQNLSVLVTAGGTWGLGTIGIGTTNTTWTASTPAGGGNFTVQNDGNVNEDLTISVADSAPWTAETAPGADAFAVGHGQTATLGTEPSYTNVTTGGVTLTSGLGALSSYNFDLRFRAPSSTSSYNQQSIVVTISASP